MRMEAFIFVGGRCLVRFFKLANWSSLAIFLFKNVYLLAHVLNLVYSLCAWHTHLLVPFYSDLTRKLSTGVFAPLPIKPRVNDLATLGYNIVTEILLVPNKSCNDFNQPGTCEVNSGLNTLEDLGGVRGYGRLCAWKIFSVRRG